MVKSKLNKVKKHGHVNGGPVRAVGSTKHSIWELSARVPHKAFTMYRVSQKKYPLLKSDLCGERA